MTSTSNSLSRLAFQTLLGKRLPKISGSIRLKRGRGLETAVTIDRDQYGIPHIRAETDADAWFGLGFAQGQDRAFQIEGLIRAGRGTLSELLGADGIGLDRMSRRIGFARAAQAQAKVQDGPEKMMTEAFVAGINAGRTHGMPWKAHELVLLGSKPLEMKPEDVLATLGLMSFLLASNWDAELSRLKILELDGEEALRAIDRGYPANQPVTNPPGTSAGPAADQLWPQMSALREFLGTSGGSNNWAVAPWRSSSGGALFANDPHLAPLLPPQWYLAHVSTPEFAVAGACFAGAPGVVSGHNGRCAWGVTAGFVDNTDLFLEEISGDGKSVREGKDFVACPRVREIIKVRRAPPVHENVLLTPRGPIVGPGLEGSPHAISLAATWLGARPLKGIMTLHRVKNFAEFRHAFDGWASMTLNFAYADTAGDIGWQLIGQPPRRLKPGAGSLPGAGWDPAYQWSKELAPFSKMPYAHNPECGYVATANNRPVASGAEDPEISLGEDWLDGYRVARIQSELASRKDWSVRAMQRLQLDIQSLPWEEMREPVLAALSGVDPELEPLRARLEAWDGKMAADSPAAAIFAVFLHELMVVVAKAKAPKSIDWVLGKGFASLLAPYSMWAFRKVGWLSERVRSQPVGWFSASGDTWRGAIRRALAQTRDRLAARAGPSVDNWAWGKVRPLELLHPFGRKALFRPIFNLGPFPWGGDNNTVAQAGACPLDPLENPAAIANLRMVVDLGNVRNSRFTLAGGQSGNPLSPHYSDLLEYWKRGEGVPIAWDENEVRAASVGTLRISCR